MYARRDDYQIPEAWREIIQGRKVVFYNTCLTAMLEHTDVYCQQLREVLEFFRSRTDFALWWRPHPLLEATFESMHPEHYEEYCQIVQQYREAGWGIYDDSADLHRAIIYSDAYYGDGSSVAVLYKKLGRPFMYQYFRPPNRPYQTFAVYEDIVGKQWFFKPIVRKGMFKVNPGTGMVASAKDYVKDDFFEFNYFHIEHVSCRQVGQVLYLLPFYTTVLRSFDMATEQYHEVDLRNISDIDKPMMCQGGEEYNGHLYLWGATYGIVDYNLATEQVEGVYSFDSLGLLSNKDSWFWLQNAACIWQQCLYIPMFGENALIIFDCITKQLTLQRIGTGYGFTNIEAVDDQIFILSNLPDLIIYHPQTGEYERQELISRQGRHFSRYFSNLFYDDGHLVILPASGEMGSLHELICIDDTGCHVLNKISGYDMSVRLDAHRIVALNLQRDQVDVYNAKGELLKAYYLTYAAEVQQQLQGCLKQKICDAIEFNLHGLSLKEWLHHVDLHLEHKVKSNAEPSGQRIYAVMMQD